MKIVENKVQSAQVISGGTAPGFAFKLERDDTEYLLPLIQDLPAKQILKLSSTEGAEGVKAMFDLFDELAPGLTDIATQRELSLIMEAWSDASNMTLGE